MPRRYKPIDTISVGDQIGLLPDDQQPRDSDQMVWYDNSKLDLGPEPLTVEEIRIIENEPMIKVTSSFKLLHMRRFRMIFAKIG
jgi:hypothetical protein